MPVVHRSLLVGPYHLVVVACVVAAGVLLWRPWTEGGEIVKRDDGALAALRLVAKAEHQFKERGLKDDGNGIPEYGTLAELSRARLLPPGLAVDAKGFIPLPGGMRIEVLLPERLEVENRRRLARAGGIVDPVLAAETFAVVALPGGDRRGGLRAYYLDERDRLWYADEITDPEPGTGTRPPPHTLERDLEDDTGAGPFWIRDKTP